MKKILLDQWHIDVFQIKTLTANERKYVRKFLTDMKWLEEYLNIRLQVHVPPRIQAKIKVEVTQ